jgi:dimethylhistidine N-methyltransferase
MKPALKKASNVTFRDEHPDLGISQHEIMQGLSRSQKTVNPKWFYDERGSQLFDQITRLPEYYPTRTELGILQDNCAEISQHCGDGCLLIEPGSGSSEKVRILLQNLRPATYVPMDISAEFLQSAALQLGEEYPWLDIYAVCADFNQGWSFVNDLPDARRVVFYPGSTLGNLEPDAAIRFLQRVRDLIGESGGALLGVDTHKSSAQLNAAYNDAEGVTAAFNLNVLRRMNQLLDADFNESQFQHDAFYNTDRRRIEMHLVSQAEQTVECSGEIIEFQDGETIHTENSYKYSQDDFAALVAAADLKIQTSWHDAQQSFGVHFLQPT